MIVPGQGTIGSRRNQGKRDFWHLVSDHRTLFGGRLDEIDLLPGIEFRKRGDRESSGNDHAVEFAFGHLGSYLFDRSEANFGGDAKQFENLRAIGAACTRPGTNTDPQSAEIVKRFDREALERRELKRAVVHRKYDAHRAISGSLRPIAP